MKGVKMARKSYRISGTVAVRIAKRAVIVKVRVPTACLWNFERTSPSDWTTPSCSVCGESKVEIRYIRGAYSELFGHLEQRLTLWHLHSTDPWLQLQPFIAFLMAGYNLYNT